MAADALLLEANGVLVDESLLTGESLPVGKRVGSGDEAPAPPGGENLPWVFAGTLMVQGDALAQVTATGIRSELGRIGTALGSIAPPPGRLQRETRTLARRMAVLGLGISMLLVALLGLRGGDWLQALLAGIALSMSVLPEECPVILTVFPAIGAWRLARQRVLTRRLAAIEILGSTSVLCVDKTGTLTENRMALRMLWRGGASHDLAHGGEPAPPMRELLHAAARASRADAADPIDRALHLAAASKPAAAPDRTGEWRLLRDYALSASRPAVVRLWHGPHGTLAAAKGAPETIAGMCQSCPAEALEAASALGREGLRVLAVAEAPSPAPPWPEDPAQLRYRFLGLVALADPLRADVPDAVAECQAAGVRIVMITGDHPETARAIARQAGLAEGAVLTGAEIAQTPPDALEARLAGVSVCARIVPSQKLEIVRALQRDGAVVAMTGDGVNDAPALRAADVGVAMGQRGTDVAREAAQLTLLDDRFASLVLALLPPLLGWPVLLYPMHIVLLELVIDPASSLAFENEPEEPGLMRQPPRPRREALFDERRFLRSSAGGLWAAALLAGFYALAAGMLPAAEARAAGFSALVLCNLGLLLVHRRSSGAGQALRTKNPVFLVIAAAALGMLAAGLYLPPFSELLRFAPPPPAWLAGAAVAAVFMSVGLHLWRRH